MDSPLQIFRELLPFGQNSAEQKSAAAVRGLLDTVAGLSPQETVAKLASSVLPTVGQQPNLHMRFKLLEDIRHECEQALPTLEQDINQAVLPLPFAKGAIVRDIADYPAGAELADVALDWTGRLNAVESRADAITGLEPAR